MLQVCDTVTWRRGASPSHTETGMVAHATILAVCLAVLSSAAILAPAQDGLALFGLRWPFSCRLHDTFGIQCALCGMSRSFCALAHGDLAGGFGFHRIGPIVFALFCLQIPYRLYALAIRPRPISERLTRLHTGLVVLIGLALFVNWIVYLGGLIL